jgi:hypothetical protein
MKAATLTVVVTCILMLLASQQKGQAFQTSPYAAKTEMQLLHCWRVYCGLLRLKFA